MPRGSLAAGGPAFGRGAGTDAAGAVAPAGDAGAILGGKPTTADSAATASMATCSAGGAGGTAFSPIAAAGVATGAAATVDAALRVGSPSKNLMRFGGDATAMAGAIFELVEAFGRGCAFASFGGRDGAPATFAP